MAIDQFIVAITAMILILPFSIYFKLQHPIAIGEKYIGFQDTQLFYYLGTFVFALYLNKDAVGGRSLAKRFMKLQIVDTKTEMPASAFACFIRNLTIIIWPIEVLISLFNQDRRIGDFIAGTKLIHFDAEKHHAKISLITMVLLIIISWVIVSIAYPYVASLRSAVL